MNYLDRDEIVDPSPRLPAELGRQISKMIPRIVVRFREEIGEARLPVLAEEIGKIFELIAPRRQVEVHPDIGSLEKALAEDADTALLYAYWICKLAGDGRILWTWHRDIERQLVLSKLRENIATGWWQRAADDNPSPLPSPTPVMTRAPQTDTMREVEAYLTSARAATEFKDLDKIDFWLRPTKADGTSNYSSDREFRKFQKEHPNLSQGIRTRFRKVLRMPPERFVEGRAERRAAYYAKRRQPKKHKG